MSADKIFFVSTTGIVVKDGRFLIAKRAEKEKAFPGKWTVPGGKITFDESIVEAATRIAERETGIGIEKVTIRTVIDERIVDDHTFKNGWFIFLATCAVRALPKKLPQNCDWFDPKELNGRIIPSDKWMIEQGLRGETPVKNVLIEEKDGVVTGFKHI